MQGYQPIENYGVIGDLHTVALVGMDGSIDFMCFPEFDSPTVFGALLDREKGGRFQLAPVLEGAKQKQMYLPDTNILLSRFLSEEGVAEVSDFMPVEEVGWAHNLVRRAKTVRGEVAFRMVCDPRLRLRPSVAQGRNQEGGGDIRLRRPGQDGSASAHARARAHRERRGGGRVQAEDRRNLRLGCWKRSCPASRRRPRRPDYVAEAFKMTSSFWRNWIGRSQYKGRWREMVNRSASRAQADDLAEVRFSGRRAHFRPAGRNRRRAQLGLPLHLDPRRFVHAVRSAAPGIHRRGRQFHGLAGRAHRRADRRRRAANHVRLGRSPAPDGGEPRLTSRDTVARRRCASETGRTISSSSTSTAS